MEGVVVGFSQAYITQYGQPYTWYNKPPGELRFPGGYNVRASLRWLLFGFKFVGNHVQVFLELGSELVLVKVFNERCELGRVGYVV